MFCAKQEIGLLLLHKYKTVKSIQKISSRTKFVSSVSYLSSAQIILNSILQLQVQMPYVSIMRYSPSSLSLLLSKELIRKRKLLQLLLIYHTLQYKLKNKFLFDKRIILGKKREMIFKFYFNFLFYAPDLSLLHHTEMLQSKVRSNVPSTLDTNTHFIPKIRENAFFF